MNKYLKYSKLCKCNKILLVDDVEFNLHILKIIINQNFELDADIAVNGEIAV
jgi:hypothetical protein